MGLFDTLYINTNKLPISDDEKKKLGDNTDFQTKSLDCIMTEIYITDDGFLDVNDFEYETVPQEERPYPNDEGLKGSFGSIRRVNERLERMKDFTGVIEFYNLDFDFIAFFKNGKLEKIERI
jgi:hypothetical protein